MNYQEFKNAVLSAAKENGLKDYELYYTESSGTSVEAYQGEINTFTSESSLGVCFKCIVDGKTGYASTENLTAEDAVSLVKRAMENSLSIESDEPSFIHKSGDNYLSCEASENTEPSSSKLAAFTLKLQSEVYKTDSRVVDGTMSASGYDSSKYALCNSNGLDLEDTAAFSYSYASALVSDGENKYDGMDIASGNLDDFDAAKIAAEAVDDAVSTIGYTSVPSGNYTVVFSSKVMASMLSTYSSVFCADTAQKGLSLLAGKEGSKVAADILTLTDDPLYKDALVKRTFDAEGAATYSKNVIEQGRLTTLLYNLATAAKAGVKTTGNAAKASYASAVSIHPYSFYINPVKGSLDDLLSAAANGIYVTSVEGMHAGANAITGDFSLSSGGFMIENSKKGKPVKGFTISGNFFSLLKDISLIGEDLKFNPFALGSSRCGSPSVLVKGITIAGK